MSHVFRRSFLPFATSILILAAIASPAAAKSYSAERFDSIVRVLADGTLEVTETVRFRFEDGTFTQVFREIPVRRTDGIDVIAAEVDGRTLPFGSETGTAQVERRSGAVRVVWRFSPVEGVTREFVLRYRARGVVRREDSGDVLEWRATPGEHQYRIAESRVRFELPSAPITPPVLNTRRLENPRITASGTTVDVTAANIGQNGWIETAMTFPSGSVATTMPGWQQRSAEIAAAARMWMIGAGVVALAGLIVLFGLRQGYDAPPDSVHGDDGFAGLPDAAGATVGGVLAANGRASLEHAMAGLFSLADRGYVEIRELPRRFGVRDFTVGRPARVPAGTLEPHEQTLLDLVFERADETGAVKLSKVRTHLQRRWREFSRQLQQDLQTAGLLDGGRQAVRRRYVVVGGILVALAALAAVPCIMLTSRYAGWPMLVPGAIVFVAIASFIFSATITPLSNEGVHRGGRWRAYKRHLAAVAKGKRMEAGSPIPTLLPFAVALGLSHSWSTFVKRRGHGVPAWFHALPGSDGSASFPAFIASGGSAAHGGGSGAASGGAAGGGASGAS